MEEEKTDVIPVDTTEVSQTETEQQPTDVKEEVEQPVETPQEEVDEKGVPIKNRLAEIERKKRQISAVEAQKALTEQPGGNSPEDPIEIVRNIVREQTAPLTVQLFLANNPDAAGMVEDINRVRTAHPEVAGIDQLDLAYKLAKIERFEAAEKAKIKQTERENLEKEEAAKSASIEGTGKVKAPLTSISDRISEAGSIEELNKIADSITG